MDAQKESDAARGELSRWSKQSSGRPARRMKETAQFTLHGRRYYCFRYKRSFFGKQWLLGVGGGYREEEPADCGHTVGGVPYQPDTERADAIRLIEERREYWMRRARGIPESEDGPSAEVRQLIRMLAPGNGRHSFACSVLLERPDFDLHRLCAQLEEDWGWPASSAHIQPGSVTFDYEGLLAALTVVDEPSVEAQQYSVNNLHWEGAVDTARVHTAHLELAVMGPDNAQETAGALSRLCASCLTQPAVTAVHAAGTLFEPERYRAEAMRLREKGCPVQNWVYIGTAQGRRGLQAFTYGMEQFGLPEMEIIGSGWERGRLEDFLTETARYALRCGRPFHSGEAAGFSRDERFPIRRSPGVLTDGMSLKIDCFDSFNKYI